MKKAVYQLGTLTCPSCIKKIEMTLESTEGVNLVKVLFNLGKVKTEFDESFIDANQIGNIIEELGYPVIKKKVS